MPFPALPEDIEGFWFLIIFVCICGERGEREGKGTERKGNGVRERWIKLTSMVLVLVFVREKGRCVTVIKRRACMGKEFSPFVSAKY